MLWLAQAGLTEAGKHEPGVISAAIAGIALKDGITQEELNAILDELSRYGVEQIASLERTQDAAGQ